MGVTQEADAFTAPQGIFGDYKDMIGPGGLS